ncbi:MAG: hypothetical protein U9P00_13920 [Pseudomonadota bacterium]|nr:hypothetical protein [Pseudomonadota bacterium]
MARLSLAKLKRHLYAAADILRREGMDAATYKVELRSAAGVNGNTLKVYGPYASGTVDTCELLVSDAPLGELESEPADRSGRSEHAVQLFRGSPIGAGSVRLYG